MDSVRYQDKHIWAQNEVSSIPGEITELSGELMLIVGYGSIGREVARRANCFRHAHLGHDAFRQRRCITRRQNPAHLRPRRRIAPRRLGRPRRARHTRHSEIIQRRTFRPNEARRPPHQHGPRHHPRRRRLRPRTQYRPNPRRRHRRRHNRADSRPTARSGRQKISSSRPIPPASATASGVAKPKS